MNFVEISTNPDPATALQITHLGADGVKDAGDKTQPIWACEYLTQAEYDDWNYKLAVMSRLFAQRPGEDQPVQDQQPTDPPSDNSGQANDPPQPSNPPKTSNPPDDGAQPPVKTEQRVVLKNINEPVSAAQTARPGHLIRFKYGSGFQAYERVTSTRFRASKQARDGTELVNPITFDISTGSIYSVYLGLPRQNQGDGQQVIVWVDPKDDKFTCDSVDGLRSEWPHLLENSSRVGDNSREWFRSRSSTGWTPCK